ncbi:hypothetical protein J5N97_015649 [Dioscorea zingiberensis]|uniref:Polygalacturonase n=1 Tax=Dioscorea zingiberensis TaxID=325984 RepID=A0A9D5HEK4_9LILI|nr:hypothetical protein J5N97_015649 [Dioscorea zingiberensis]
MFHLNSSFVLLSITTGLLLLVQALPRVKANYNNIVSYGAKPDGQTDSSGSLLSAWQAACTSKGSSTIYIPSGTFMLKPVTLSGPCESNKIIIHIDGTLIAPSSYNITIQWIRFKLVDGVSIYGGTINGQVQALWFYKSSSNDCPAGATSLIFSNSKNIVISGLTLINSELFHIVIHGCEGVQVQGVKISAPGNSPNTDGIHVQKSTNVMITGTDIKTGDDCVSIGFGTTNLWIEDVTCGLGHGIRVSTGGLPEGRLPAARVPSPGVRPGLSAAASVSSTVRAAAATTAAEQRAELHRRMLGRSLLLLPPGCMLLRDGAPSSLS